MNRLLLFSLTVSIWACSSPTELARPDENGRLLGTIEHYGDPVGVELPSHVERGEDFTVTVTTYGGGCIAKGETESEVEGLRAVVTPFDYDAVNLPANAACPDILYLYAHTATLRFDERGEAQVVIRGQQKPSREVITVKRTVIIE